MTVIRHCAAYVGNKLVRRCPFMASKDGYCGQHHPDKVAATRRRAVELAEQRLAEARAALNDYESRVWEPFDRARCASVARKRVTG